MLKHLMVDSIPEIRINLHFENYEGIVPKRSIVMKYVQSPGVVVDIPTTALLVTYSQILSHNQINFLYPLLFDIILR